MTHRRWPLFVACFALFGTLLALVLPTSATGEESFTGGRLSAPQVARSSSAIAITPDGGVLLVVSFWGTPIYESFREWLESPYAEQGIECQDCHMVPTGVNYFVFPEKGGLIRNPQTIASHLQPGAADEELLQNTVEMAVEVRQRGGQLWATVAITNTEAGHHVPTDFPGRHMILTVAADEGQGRLAQERGPVVPDWGGAQAGLPGKAFAKVLRDVESGEAPVVSYWKQALIVSDNRIPAMGRDVSSYVFTAPAGGGPVTVTVDLRFRRAFQEVMDARGWEAPDITMEREAVSLSLDRWWQVYLPCILR